MICSIVEGSNISTNFTRIVLHNNNLEYGLLPRNNLNVNSRLGLQYFTDDNLLQKIQKLCSLFTVGNRIDISFKRIHFLQVFLPS